MTCPLWPGAKGENNARPCSQPRNTVITLPFFLSPFLIIYLFFPPLLSRNHRPCNLANALWPRFPSYRYLDTVTRIARSMGQSAYLGVSMAYPYEQASKVGRQIPTPSWLPLDQRPDRRCIQSIGRPPSQTSWPIQGGGDESRKKKQEKRKAIRRTDSAAGPPSSCHTASTGSMRFAASY